MVRAGVCAVRVCIAPKASGLALVHNKNLRASAPRDYNRRIPPAAKKVVCVFGFLVLVNRRRYFLFVWFGWFSWFVCLVWFG